MTTTRETTVGYIALLRTNPNFRWIWLGQVVSLFGDWFNLIASAALIAQLTRSGLAVGGLFVVRMLAPFLISPAAGVATDRFNRKALLMLTPSAMRGRTFSSEFALFTLANAAGAAAGGWLLDNTALGLTAMMAWMAAFTLLPWLLWSLWEKSGMKNQPASWSEYG